FLILIKVMVCENRHTKICHCSHPEYVRKKCPHCLLIFKVCTYCKGKQEHTPKEVKHKHPKAVTLQRGQITNPNQAMGKHRIIKYPDANQKGPTSNNAQRNSNQKDPISNNVGQGPIIQRNGVLQINNNTNTPFHINSSNWSPQPNNCQTCQSTPGLIIKTPQPNPTIKDPQVNKTINNPAEMRIITTPQSKPTTNDPSGA